MSAPQTTADFLFELGTEELPPTALRSLSQSLTEGILQQLKNASLSYCAEGVEQFATPRRLAVFIPQLQCQQEDSEVKKLGPALAAAYDKTGAPTKAALGFANSNGTSVEQLEREMTDKGERLCFNSRVAGKPAEALLPEILAAALDSLPIAKKMRWGASRTEFVRPAHWLLALLDERVVDCQLLGLTAGRESFGHRFHAPDAFAIPAAKDYQRCLQEQGAVIASFEARRQRIIDQVQKISAALGGSAVIEDALLDEVTALVEQPTALAGKFDDAFLSVPHEALIYSMSEHQKYFHIVDQDGQLMPYFIAVSNIDSKQPEQIINGNERVIRPRLADAAFFFETDKKVSLAALRQRLQQVLFQKQLGTVYQKTERIAALAGCIAEKIGADSAEAILAGELCKADLASDMVLEFDKMQGVAGAYYARHDGLPEAVAEAIGSHYLPRFSGDDVPSSKLACAVALADRLDTLIGIFGIGLEPSGSKDPFALRRASIAVLQIILQNRLSLNLEALLTEAAALHTGIDDPATSVDKALRYIFDRFAAVYQEQGLPSEVFTAVKAKSTYDPLDFDARVNAVAAFIKTRECESLASANKRVNNILAKAVEQGATTFDPGLLQEPAESVLAEQLAAQQQRATPLLANGNYRDSLLQLTELKPAVDSFFDSVMVNADDPALKKNRLALLSLLKTLFSEVADISLLAVKQQ